MTREYLEGESHRRYHAVGRVEPTEFYNSMPDPRQLGIIGGVSDAIVVVDHRKHWGIDPSDFEPEQLRRIRNPRGSFAHAYPCKP